MPKLIDLTGEKFGEWTIIQRAKTKNDKYKSWLCRCKCGTEKILGSNYIRKTWKPTDCGCSNTIVGKKFSMLLVVEKMGKKCNTFANYRCICDCGREKITRGAYLVYGHRKSCGCNFSHKASAIGPRTVFNHYKQAAKKRKLGFSLSKEELKEIIERECYYCAEEHSNAFSIKKVKNSEPRFYLYNGIERINNENGYFKENCVACCRVCNLMKRSLSVDEWKKQMEKILENMQTKEKETEVKS